MYPSVYELEKLGKMRHEELLRYARDRAVLHSRRVRNVDKKHEAREHSLGIAALFGSKRQRALRRTV